jgi:quinol monooxygenase YgiN
MPGIRVIVTINLPDAETATATAEFLNKKCKQAQAEAGALQYELFRSFDNPKRLILLEHWESKALYDKHWIDQVKREGVPDSSLAESAFSEFYHHGNYEILDGIWQPKEEKERLSTIRWI